jgi:hypothetical protein
MALQQMEQPLTAKESVAFMKKMMKTNKKKLTNKDFAPGKILNFGYDAKDKTATWDSTPLVIVLLRGKSYTLGVNLHWAPVPLRIILVKKILQLNKNNIKNKKPLELNYKDVKPFLKKVGFAPIIRLYINKRITSMGIVIPDEHLMNAAKLKTETFTQGKVDAETLYKIALRKNKKYRQERNRRQ